MLQLRLQRMLIKESINVIRRASVLRKLFFLSRVIGFFGVYVLM